MVRAACLMSENDAESEEKPKKKGLKPILFGFVLLLVGGGAGFGVVSAGLLGPGDKSSENVSAKVTDDVAFVPLEPMIVSVGRGGRQRHLKFQAQLEVAPQYVANVTAVLPRVVDILNGYLRAVEVSDIEEPAALVKLRAQMLRRVQIVVGEELVSDLLISEFVLN